MRCEEGYKNITNLCVYGGSSCILSKIAVSIAGAQKECGRWCNGRVGWDCEWVE